MKNSGIEWIGDIPDDWEVKRLKDVVISMNSGGTPTSSDESFYSDNGTPWVIIADMKTDLVFDTQKKLTEKGLADKKLHVYPQGTILYAMYASVGKVSELKIDAAVNQAILAIIVDKYSTNNTFFKYCLKAYEQFVAAESNGNTQYNLNAYKVSNFSFAFCYLSMQEIIAEFLDKKCAAVDRLIENQSKQIEKLKEYKQSVITEAVTKGLNPSVPMKDSGLKIGVIPTHWKIIQFKFVAKLSNGKEVTSDSGDIPVYGSGGVFKYTNDYLFNGVSLLMGRKGTIDNPMLVNGKFWTVDTMFYTSEIKRLLPKFLYYLAKSVLDYGYYKSGSVLPSMTQTEINNIRLTYPPIEEQQQIADYLDKKCEKIDKLIAIKQQKIEKLNEYKKSLIYEYVTGKKEVV